MNVIYKTIAAVIAIVCASSVAAQGAAPLSEEAKARKAVDNARAFEQNARTLTLFDRQGKRLNTVGTRALYGNPVFSRDGTKLAYVKRDLEQENADLWTLDLATGREVQLTHGKMREQLSQAVWSPDSSQVVYTALRDGKYGVYRRAANGEVAKTRLLNPRHRSAERLVLRRSDLEPRPGRPRWQHRVLPAARWREPTEDHRDLS